MRKPIATFTILALPLAAICFGVTSRAEGGCRRVELTIRPGWATTGSWTDSGDLLIVDSRRRSILRYSNEGRTLGDLSARVNGVLKDLLPQEIKSNGREGFVVKSAKGSILRLDSNLRPSSPKGIYVTAPAKSQNAGTLLAGAYQWAVADGSIVAFSDMQGPKGGVGSLSSGFVRFPVDRPEAYSVLYPMLHKSVEHVFYRLGYPYIAMLSGRAYALLMSTPIQLLKEEGQKMASIPALSEAPHIALAPQLPNFDEKGDIVSLARALEHSSMPTGMYAWEGYLYILSRKVEASLTSWYLTKVDVSPGNEGTLKPVLLRGVSSSYLTVVPGPQSWAFLEKGPVQGWGRQDIRTMTLVPAKEIRKSFAQGTDLCR